VKPKFVGKFHAPGGITKGAGVSIVVVPDDDGAGGEDVFGGLGLPAEAATQKLSTVKAVITNRIDDSLLVCAGGHRSMVQLVRQPPVIVLEVSVQVLVAE
jgi:hypothetical protein